MQKMIKSNSGSFTFRNSVIYYATNVVIKSWKDSFRKLNVRDPTVLRKSFYFDKLSGKQIELILEENSNITEQCLID